MGKTSLVVEPGKQELSVTRDFDAPRELVFRAHTDPDLLVRWWGPRYLTNEVDTLEARTGGSWRFIQRDPEGGVHAFRGVFHAVVPLERLVMTFEYEGEPGHVSLETMTFEEQDGKTILHAHSVFQSLADRDGMVAAGMEGGMNEGYERLDELVAELQRDGLALR